MENTNKMFMYQNQAVKSSTIWLFFLFFGWSYGSMNKIGLQILFYLTLGGLGVWTLIRLFTLGGAIKEYNKSIAMKCGLNNQEIAQMGLV